MPWRCEKFLDYLTREYFEIGTDHNPLILIFTRKHLDHDLCLRRQIIKLSVVFMDDSDKLLFILLKKIFMKPMLYQEVLESSEFLVRN